MVLRRRAVTPQDSARSGSWCDGTDPERHLSNTIFQRKGFETDCSGEDPTELDFPYRAYVDQVIYVNVLMNQFLVLRIKAKLIDDTLIATNQR